MQQKFAQVGRFNFRSEKLRWNCNIKYGQTGAAIVVSPTVTTTYTAKCKVGNCESEISANYTITVTPISAPRVAASKSTITKGETVVLKCLWM